MERKAGAGRHGFTLLEVGLAITVGLVLITAGLMAFESARDHAGDSAARMRLSDLQVIIEDDYTRTGSFPGINLLREQWIARRPDDATASPWGGVVTVDSGVQLIRRSGIEGRDDLAPSPAPIGGPSDESSRNSAVLYYYRIRQPGAPPPPPGWSLWDASARTYVPVSGYAVAANKKYRAFFFVQSGRTP